MSNKSEKSVESLGTRRHLRSAIPIASTTRLVLVLGRRAAGISLQPRLCLAASVVSTNSQAANLEGKFFVSCTVSHIHWYLLEHKRPEMPQHLATLGWYTRARAYRAERLVVTDESCAGRS
jgi:hypothetical protein